jgi:uncharacterized membrane protein YheB (UPF0754 family)
MNITLLSIPFISAFIGWFTNWIAIKMLFHPKEPKKILGITFQGIFPKRQMQFAQKLGILVSTELINMDDIKNKLIQPETLEKVMPQINEELSGFIDAKLSEHLPLVSMFISNETITKIKTGLSDELKNSFPKLIDKLGSHLDENINIEKIVTEKVAAFSSDKLESILVDIMNKEFKFIEIIGAVLGFLIGLLQIGLTSISL